MSCFQMTTDKHMIEWHNYPKGRIGHLYIVAGFFSKRKKSKLEQHGVLSAFYLTLKRNRLECRLQICMLSVKTPLGLLFSSFQP